MREEKETVYYTDGGRRCESKLEALESEAVDACLEFFEAGEFRRTTEMAHDAVVKLQLWTAAKVQKDEAF